MNLIKNHRTFLLSIILYSAVFVSCAHRGDWSERISWKEFAPSTLPGEKEYPLAKSIVVLNEGKMEISSSGSSELSVFEYHRIVKVLDCFGQNNIDVVIPYSPDSDFELLQARTISPDGRITVLDEKNIYDVTAYPKFVFYSDQRAKIFTFPCVEKGALLEFRYRINIHMHTFYHYWSFQESDPDLISRFTLMLPSNWKVNYKIKGGDLEPQIGVSADGTTTTMVWEARNVEPFKEEFGQPPFREVGLNLIMSPINIYSWDDVANWYYNLIKLPLEPGDGIRELTSRLIEGIEDKKERLRRIYQWIRDNVRYVAIEIGKGGYQPHPAEEVLKNRYGDCKDMVTLLCSMAREGGIDVYEAMISTWENGICDTTLPSQLQFNHVIAFSEIDSDRTVWMDPTAKGTPFGRLPWYDQGLPVLVVKNKGSGEILMTPSEPADSNLTVHRWRVSVDSSGAALIDGETRLWGANSDGLREELLFSSFDGIRRWMELFLVTRCSGAVLDTFYLEGLNPVEDPLCFKYSFHSESFASREDGVLSLQPGSVLIFDIPKFFSAKERKHPVRLLYGSKRSCVISIRVPEGWKLRTSSTQDSVVSMFGSMHTRVNNQKGDVIIELELTTHRCDVKPNLYPLLKDFLDRVERMRLRRILLSRD